MQRSILYLFVMLTLVHGGCAHPRAKVRRRPVLETWREQVPAMVCSYSPARQPLIAPVESDIAPEASVSQYAPPPLTLSEWVADVGGTSEVAADKTLRVVLNECPVRGRMADLPAPESISDLELNDVDLSDADWPALGDMHSLSILQLNGTSCNDQKLQLLKELDKLELLSLARTEISNQGLKQLAAMEHLRFLILDETSIDDEGVFFLKQMKHLEGLSLVGTQISAKEVEKLKSELIDCTIVNRSPNNIPVPEPEQTTSAEPRPMPMPVIRPDGETLNAEPIETQFVARPLSAWSVDGESVAMYVPGDRCITVARRDQPKPRKIAIHDFCVELGFANSDTLLAVTRSKSGRLGLQRWNAMSGEALSKVPLSAGIASAQFVLGSPLMMLEGHDGTSLLVNYESQEVLWKDGCLLPETSKTQSAKHQGPSRDHAFEMAIPVFR